VSAFFDRHDWVFAVLTVAALIVGVFAATALVMVWWRWVIWLSEVLI
jgi:hypothetical protein